MTDGQVAVRLDLSITPSQSLGCFRLGTSLWELANFLREAHRDIPKVDFQYSEEDPLHTSIILCLVQNGITLRFNGTTQRLISIECWDLSKVMLTYQMSEISSNKAVPTFIGVHKAFGPTYPGKFDPDRNSYSLDYPGVSFVFPIPSRYTHLYSGSSDDLPSVFPDGTTPVAEKVFVNTSAQSLALHSKAAETRRDVSKVDCKPGWGCTLHFGPSANINHAVHSKTDEQTASRQETPSPQAGTSTPSPRPHSSNQHTNKVDIIINKTTPQDLLADLGAPSRIFYKEEDKMRIHREGRTESNVLVAEVPDTKYASDTADQLDYDDDANDLFSDALSTDYFYNYFHLGIDVLFHGALHVCKKIILHGNVPGHFDFGRYKRCPWRLQLSDSQNISGDAHIDTIIKAIPSLQGAVNDVKQTRPVTFTRGSSVQNPFGYVTLMGTDEGLVFEVMKNGYIGTVVVFL